MPKREFTLAMNIQEKTGKPPHLQLNRYWNRAMDCIEENNYNNYAYYSIKSEQRLKRLIESKRGDVQEVHLMFNSARNYAHEGHWSMVHETMMDIHEEVRQYGIWIPAVV